MNKNFKIGIAGNIGVGKTTLTDKLSKDLNTTKRGGIPIENRSTLTPTERAALKWPYSCIVIKIPSIIIVDHIIVIISKVNYLNYNYSKTLDRINKIFNPCI